MSSEDSDQTRLIRPVWSESLLSAWRNLGSLATHWAHSEDSAQSVRMPRLIWVVAGRAHSFRWFCHVVTHFTIAGLDNHFTTLKDVKPIKSSFTTQSDDRLCLDKLDTGISLTPPPLKPHATLVPDLQLQADLKRLGSPCSNSSDSGLSDINSSLSANGNGADHTDPLRPRIWSLAHVATSTGGSNTLLTIPEQKDQNANLTMLKPGTNSLSMASSMSMTSPSFSSTGNAMRPWLDTTFNVGSSLFTPMSGTYSTLGTQRPRETPSNVVNQSLNSLSGLSNPSLSRPYPSLSSLYTPVRDLTKRSMDGKLSDICS